MRRMSSEPGVLRSAVFAASTGQHLRGPASAAHEVRWVQSQRAARVSGWWLCAVLAVGLGVSFARLRSAPPEPQSAAREAAPSADRFEAGPRSPARARHAPALRRSALGSGPSARPGASSAPERSPAPAGVRVSGRVLDAQGGPVVGAAVVARTAPSQPPLARAVSGERGEFVLAVPSGPLQLQASAAPYAIALADVLAPARHVTLVMAPSASIIGQVVASDTGAGVPDVLVTASNVSDARVPPVSVRSGEDGFFRVENVPGGGYRLGAASAAHAGGPLWVAVAVGQASDAVRLVVAPATHLSARISVNGVPCSDGEVVLSGSARASAAIGTNGVARVDGVRPGISLLRAICRGGLAREEQLVVGREPIERLWDLEPGLAVLGTVLDAAGRAVSGARVQVTAIPASGAGAVGCTSDTAGEFSCSGLAPGVVEVRVAAEGRVPGEPARLELAPGRLARVGLRLGAAGAIRAAFAGAAPALPVYVRGTNGQPILGRVAAGVAWFEGLPLGHYDVHVGHAGAARAQGVDLAEAGQVVDVQLAAPRLRSIAGRVLGETGLPVRGAWVRAEIAAGAARVPIQAGHASLTDETGRFLLAALPPGDYDVTASSAAGNGRARLVPAGAAGVTIAFETFGRLIGTVTTDAGQRPAAFVVAYVRTGGPGGQVSGKDGHWLLPWAPPGEYRLTITSETGQARGYAVLPAGGEAQVLSVTGAPAH